MRVMRVYILFSAIVFAATLPACERGKQEEKDASVPSLSFDDNGVRFSSKLDGWTLAEVQERPRLHRYTKKDVELLVQLRKYKPTSGRKPSHLDLQDALVEFCQADSCNTQPLKPGYWVNHYVTYDDGKQVVNWDIGTLGENDDLLIAIVKVIPGKPSAHNELDRSFETSLSLERIGIQD